jgi:putative transcriptional regulator
MARWMLLALTALALQAAAQPRAPNAVLLVAKPGLTDPNFRETVVLATQAEDGSTVGVILNRPTKLRAADLLRGIPSDKHKLPVYFGGPVMKQVVVALFRSESTPEAPVFPVLRGTYVSLHPAAVQAALERGGDVALFAGFSGWAPGQLAGELQRDGWFVLPARAEALFRRDTSGMWNEMVERARGERASNELPGISPGSVKYALHGRKISIY